MTSDEVTPALVPTHGSGMGPLSATGADWPQRLEWAQQVARAMRSLPPMQLVAVRMIYAAEYTQAQAAAHLDLPVQQLGRLVADGLQSLGAALTGESPTV